MPSFIRRLVTTRIHQLIVLLVILINILVVTTNSHCELLKPARLSSTIYQIDAVIDTDKKIISAKQKVSFTNFTAVPTDALYFHLYANRQYTPREKAFMMRYAGYFKADPFPGGFPLDPVKIIGISLDGKPLSFSVDGDDKTILKVSLPKPLAGGEPVTIEMNYTVDIPNAYGRFGWHNNIFALSRWYPILSVYNDEGWNNYPFYPFHRPFFADAALYKMRLRVASNQVVVHTGDLVKETPNGSDKVLDIETPLPVREFTMAMSSDYRVVEGKHNITTVKSYYLPGREKRAREALNTALELMDFYAQKFGDYPYKTFSIAPVTLGYGGEQMSNLVFIDSRVYDLPRLLQRYFNFLIAHEAGHQWFYNVLGIDSYKEIWMEEGFNSYFILEFFQNKYGIDAGVIDLNCVPEWLRSQIPNLSFRKTTGVRYKMIARQGLDHPIIDRLSGYAEPSTIFSLAYGKGSIVLGMLKELIGQEAFDRVYRRIFQEYAFDNLSLHDFMRICQEESRMDLTDFFNGWLKTAQKFDVSVQFVKGQEITLKNRGSLAMPVDVNVAFTDGTTKALTWDSKSKLKTLDAQGGAPIKSVVLDENEQWLDLDRTNNYWPRQWKIKPVAFYFPVYDLPFFMPEDSYNVVVGPELNQGLGIKASVQKPYDQILYGATDYDFNNKWQTSRVGYELQNVLNSLMTAGVEMQNRTDFKDGEDDLVSGKLYLRQELWPAAYGLFDVNDHITYYLIRNQSLRSSKLFAGSESIRNASYLKSDEAIVGTALHLGRSRPYPDPREGFNIDAMVENSGHFWGATQQFTRAMLDYSVFSPVTLHSKLAWRLKYGWGSARDKNLFELGGIDGLRGFDRKTVRGANAALSTLEYRFPLINNINWDFMDHVIGLQKISGVAFFDLGQSWYDSFSDSQLRKDAGMGLRFHMNIGSFLEQAVVRLDVAHAINDDGEDVHYWFAVNHQF